jgi:hypothetical protein
MDKIKQPIKERAAIQAMLDSLKSTLTDRHEELGSLARSAYEDGDDEDRDYYRNKQEGVFECLKRLEELIQSNNKPSR